MNGFTAHDVPDQRGKCFIVTGANTGIGFEIARALAGKGARVLIGCRDAGRAADAIARIGAPANGGDVSHLPLDLADLSSIRAAAVSAAREPRIDGLINNAGIMFPPLSHTQDGFELQFGVNHLGPFALTALMLPVLEQTPGARVVITSSLAHKGGDIAWDDLGAARSYSRSQRYSDSKLANLLHLYELDRRLRASGSKISAIGCHPGIAATDLGRHAGPFRVLFAPVGLIFNSAAQGAWPALQAATDSAAVAGGYYGPTRFWEAAGPAGPAARSKAASDPALASRLWDVSADMTGIAPGLPPA